MNSIPLAPSPLLLPTQFVRGRFLLLPLGLVCAATLAFADFARAGSQSGGLPSLEQRVAALESLVSTLQQVNSTLQSQLAAVQTTLAPVKLVGSDLIFEGCNVHVRSGSGATDGTVNGLGNLIIGYSEKLFGYSSQDRSGSHNLVVGRWHTYSSYGGFVAGELNSVEAPGASVSGGFANSANGLRSSVTGGSSNKASNSGSVVSGGFSSRATGAAATVNGGWFNIAGASYSTVNGGYGNTATGILSTVGGGFSRTAATDHSWVAGALFQPN